MAEKNKIKKRAVKKSSKKTSDEVCEIFEIDKNGNKKNSSKLSQIKEKEITSCGKEEVQEVKEGQLKSENKILRNILITISIVIILFFGFIYFSASIQKFEYRDIDFKIVKQGQLILYNTALKIMQNGQHVADYNFYLRNDPRKLDKIPFNSVMQVEDNVERVSSEGNIQFAKNAVINITGDFTCEGDGTIAIANVLSLLKVIGITTIKDSNATCMKDGSYTFMQIEKAEETGIEQFGKSCYKIKIKNCEVLKATEKFMVEIFAKINARVAK